MHWTEILYSALSESRIQELVPNKLYWILSAVVFWINITHIVSSCLGYCRSSRVRGLILLLFHLQTVCGRGAAIRWQLGGLDDSHVCLPLVWPAALSPGGPQSPEAPWLLGSAQLHHWHGAQLPWLLLTHTQPSLQRGAYVDIHLIVNVHRCPLSHMYRDINRIFTHAATVLLLNI